MDAARAATRLAREHRTAGIEVATKSSLTDLVTTADRACETSIAERVLGRRPDDGFVGEEHTQATSRSGVTWIVDPIDGTTNFVYGHPGWACSIAAEVDGRVLAGVVADATAPDLYTAVAGRGAWRNGVRLSLAEPAPLPQALVATGFGYDAGRRRRQAQILELVIDRVRDVRRVGAASLDLCSVAAGRVDAYYEWGLARWDFAAGALVATEAGAVVAHADGGPPRPDDLIIAAHPDRWDELRDVVTHAERATRENAADGHPHPERRGR